MISQFSIVTRLDFVHRELININMKVIFLNLKDHEGTLIKIFMMCIAKTLIIQQYSILNITILISL